MPITIVSHWIIIPGDLLSRYCSNHISLSYKGNYSEMILFDKMAIKIQIPTVKDLIYFDCREVSAPLDDISYFHSSLTSEHGS
jgi:hypothetical protein